MVHGQHLWSRRTIHHPSSGSHSHSSMGGLSASKIARRTPTAISSVRLPSWLQGVLVFDAVSTYRWGYGSRFRQREDDGCRRVEKESPSTSWTPPVLASASGRDTVRKKGRGTQEHTFGWLGGHHQRWHSLPTTPLSPFLLVIAGHAQLLTSFPGQRHRVGDRPQFEED